MGSNSKIEWTDHTFNPWIGCTKVSPGCANCYAEELMDKRYGKAMWGPEGARVVTSDSNWRQPIAWNRAAAASNTRARVFCASLADVWEDRPELDGPRLRLMHLIRETAWLDWLLLTKRPANVPWLLRRVLNDVRNPALHEWLGAWIDGDPPANVWLGASVEDQLRADERIPALLAVPAAVRFLSVEPLLGPVHLGLLGMLPRDVAPAPTPVWQRLHWVIVGGESGRNARLCDLANVRLVVQECRAARVPVFVKQLGARPMCGVAPYRLRDAKGGDPTEWPEDLRVQQFPEAIAE